MNNYQQPGDSLSLVAPYARSAGDGAKVGSIFGVAVDAIGSGATGQFRTEGVFSLPKDTTAITQGLKVYWDDSAKKITATSTSNLPVGLAIEAQGTAATTVAVKLNAVPPNTGA